MALYDGFFDAVWDEQTETYDRTYDSGDFTAYFGAFVGSGVCVYQNPDSMKVSFRQGKAVVAPGYLFIQGYWLKNDAEYGLPLGGRWGLRNRGPAEYRPADDPAGGQA